MDNAAIGLRPEAYVDVTIEIDQGTGITIPVDAVLPTGEHNLIFVDRGAGKLEPRFVQVGGHYGESIAVTSGLKAGRAGRLQRQLPGRRRGEDPGRRQILVRILPS